MPSFRLLLAIGLAPALLAQTADPAVERAIQVFIAHTRELGLRQDEAKSAPKEEWHGRLYEFFRNDALDAIPHEVRQGGLDKSILRRNQFGFSVAGPVVLPHLVHRGSGTYFTLNYEGVRESIARASLRTTPTLPERGGDYSAVVDQAGNPLPIYDPASTRANAAYDPSRPVGRDNLQYLRDPFPQNRIPEARLDAIAQKALAYYPRPNTSIGPFFRNNYFVNSPETNTADGVIARVDQSILERHRVALNLTASNGFRGQAQVFPTLANSSPADQRFESRKGLLEHVFTLSARTVNRLAFEVDSDAVRGGSESNQVDFGVMPGGQERNFFPCLYIDPYVPMGQPHPLTKNSSNVYTWSEDMSTRRGGHSLGLNLQYMLRQVNFFGAESPAGELSFGPGLTGLPGITGTGQAFASFVLGLAQTGAASIVPAPSYFRRGSGQISAREQWDVRKGLTLNFKLTVNRDEPRVEKYDRMSTVDLAAINPANGRPGALIVAGRNGASRGFRPTVLHLAPDAGLAWNPWGDSRTVVRLRWARGRVGIESPDSQWGTQAFTANPTYISPNVQLQPAVVLAQGFPAWTKPVPNFSPDAANDLVADLIDMTDRLPLFNDFHFDLERQLPGSAVATLSVLHSTGTNLLVGNGAADPNAIPLDALRYRDRLNDEAFARSLRPYPQYKDFFLGGSWPSGRYKNDGLSARLEKKSSRGLYLGATYTFSKNMDDFSGPGGNQDLYRPAKEWSINSDNVRHQLQVSWIYELPVGANKPWLRSSTLARHILGGWSVIGTGVVQSGAPLALRALFNNTGGAVPNLRPDVVPGVDPRVADPGPALWFNPAAFDQPADFSLGNASRTHPSLLNPGMQNFDLSLSKRVRLAGERNLEFTAAGFNSLNHANWNEPDATIGPASAPNVNAGKIVGSRGGRVMQLGVRLSF